MSALSLCPFVSLCPFFAFHFLTCLFCPPSTVHCRLCSKSHSRIHHHPTSTSHKGCSIFLNAPIHRGFPDSPPGLMRPLFPTGDNDHTLSTREQATRDPQ